nr:glycosyltransferase family 4 protein [Spirochaetaceae bacterium]
HQYREKIKFHIKKFIEQFSLDLLIPQNAITIPLNIPLGLAFTEICSETGIPVIAHHHDFFWERKRFLRNCVWDYINMSFPPHIPNIQHVVINSSAQNQLGLRTGISSTLIPNVMDFKVGPPSEDHYIDSVRADLGLKDEELLILQPTRVVQRKGIEHSLELMARLDMNAKLVISHASGDEGYEYQQRVIEYAELLGVNALFVDDIIKEKRGTTDDGRKIYTLEDIYSHADLVTYPSLIEGFGNALLETFWFKKPILLNNYSIYSTDIRPKGFKVIEMDDFISHSTIDQTRFVLKNPEIVKEMTETNYQLGLKHYSFEVLEKQLTGLLAVFFGG